MSAAPCSCPCSCHEVLAQCQKELQLCQQELQGLKEELAACRSQGPLAQSAPESPPVPPSPTQLLTDYLLVGNGSGPWLEAHLHELADISNGVAVPGLHIALNVWQFAPMQPGETLQEHVQRQVQGGNCPGPDSETSLAFMSNSSLGNHGLSSLEQAQRAMSPLWRTVARFRGEWQAILKNFLAGNYDPIVTRTVIFGNADKGTESRGMKSVIWPAVLLDRAGQRYWGMVWQAFPATQAFLNTWRLRDYLTVAHTPSCISVVAVEGGAIMWQNPASMAIYGAHGRFNTSAKHGEGLDAAAAGDDLVVSGSQFNFVDLIFDSNKGELDEMRAAVKSGDNFRTTIQVVHPTLRGLMGLKEGEEVHQDVQMALTRDPATLEQVYTVAQIDVTAAVLAKRQVQLAHAALEEEKVRTEVLLHRQYELVDCLGWVSEVGRSAAGNSRAAELIDSVRRQIVDGGGGSADGRGEEIELLELLGEGTFGKVYKGLWRDKEVAVKRMVLPKTMNGSEKKERMAIMEAAISSSLSHPNIIQTYTYSLKPVRDSSSSSASLERQLSISSGSSDPKAHGPQAPSCPSLPGRSSSSISAFEVQIVLELCDRGTLRDALRAGCFRAPGTGAVNYRAVLECAADVARGMRHLHACNILHSDLKAANVLLQSNGDEARGVTAKVADFGLSVQMSVAETHVSGLCQGTVTHMSPETQLSGQQSNAADVYAFGITLWELYTGERPYPDVPRAYLGYQVVREDLRPLFPDDTPPGYQALAERCWDASPAARPSFAEALEVLEALRDAEPGATPPLHDGTDATPAAAAPRPTAGAYAFHPAPAPTAPSPGDNGCNAGALPPCAPDSAPLGQRRSDSLGSGLVLQSLESDWLEGLAGTGGKPSHPPPLTRPPGPRPPPRVPEPDNLGMGTHPAPAAAGPAAAPPTTDDDSHLGNSCLVMTSVSQFSYSM